MEFRLNGLVVVALLFGSMITNAAPPTTSSLSVSVNGSGTVTSAPAGIACPSDCDEAFRKRTHVTLTASPATGQTFVGWGGACAGTATTCSLRISAPMTTVTAEFTQATASYPAPVPQTGQTICVGAINGHLSCSGTGQDGEIRAGVPLPTPRFMDNGNGTVTDNLTGLQWLKDLSCFGSGAWLDAFSLLGNFNSGGAPICAEYTAGTFADWRIANINELRSLINYGYQSPAVSNTAGNGKWTEGDPFLNMTPLIDGSADIVVSSTPVYQEPSAANNSSIWGIRPVVGDVRVVSGGYVWLVRGPK